MEPVNSSPCTFCFLELSFRLVIIFFNNGSVDSLFSTVGLRNGSARNWLRVKHAQQNWELSLRLNPLNPIDIEFSLYFLTFTEE